MPRFKQAPAMSIAAAALFVSLGGGAYAATTLASGSVGTRQLRTGAVTHSKLAANSVWAANIGRGSVQPRNLDGQIRAELASRGNTASNGATGPAGPRGPKGDTGATGPQGPKGDPGQNGANPASPVINVPAITTSSSNPNPDSGTPGDQGFYFTGTGSGGSASIAGGELILTGVGVDSKTWQGGIGIAKAYSRVPLGNLDGVSFDYHVGTPAGNDTPVVHVTVIGLTHDSKYSSGFANLTYAPVENGATVSAGQDYTADAFLPGAKWYSSTESSISSPGGQDDPQPLSYFVSSNPNAVIGQISLDNGGSSGASGSFTAGADDLVLGFRGSITRYDFGG